jgi:hypothetical protein
VLHSGGAADVFLEGKVLRHGMLSRDHHGPRAVLNAIERLASSYDQQAETARQELAIAEGQLRDHEARIGRRFLHDAYMRELTDLRDQLKAGLSQATPEPGTVTVAELAERIKTLHAAHTIDAVPVRTAIRRIAAEEPVTARVRRRNDPAAIAIEPPSETEPTFQSAEIPPKESVAPAVIVMPIADTPQPAYRQQVTRGRREIKRQLSLF